MRISWKHRVALIGYGAITDEIVASLATHDELAAVLVRSSQLDAARLSANGRFAVVDTLDALLRERPEMVVECAGHGALSEYGPVVLEHGVDLLVASVGALANGAVAAKCASGAAGGRASIWIPSGAIAGIDGLIASRTAGLKHVTYTSVKPPPAWIGTSADQLIAQDSKSSRIVFFEGTAREAARSYPKNANVGATIALAGLGLDLTRVRLVSDPEAQAPLGIIEADGDFGTFRFEILAHASARNPKTSLLTAHSLMAAWRMGVCFQLSSEALATASPVPERNERASTD